MFCGSSDPVIVRRLASSQTSVCPQRLAHHLAHVDVHQIPDNGIPNGFVTRNESTAEVSGGASGCRDSRWETQEKAQLIKMLL